MSKLSLNHQDLYKVKTPPWKETYRKRCLARLRSSRSKLQSKFRQLTDETLNCASESKEDFIRSLMTEEWQDMKSENYNGGPKDKCDVADDGWDFDVEDVLTLFEDIQAELRKEEEKLLAKCDDYESSLLEEEASLCAALNTLNTEEVLCPMCKKHSLLLNKGIIFCKCGLRVNTEQDGVTLKNVKQNLTDAADVHSACHSTVTFSVLTDYGAENLLMTCEDCDFMYVIV